jgi:hypothetical protein
LGAEFFSLYIICGERNARVTDVSVFLICSQIIGAMEEHGGLVLDTDNGELRVGNQRGLDCMARLDEIPSLRDELASQRDELASQRITISSLQDRVNRLTMSLDAYKLL